MTDPVPTHLDWVKARLDCSLPSIFLTLAEVVKSDVASATARIPGATFTVEHATEHKLIVNKAWTAAGYPQGDAVTFELQPTRGIRVTRAHADRPLFFAKPALQPDGVCKLEIEGDVPATPLALWQVSRRALERLFFED